MLKKILILLIFILVIRDTYVDVTYLGTFTTTLTGASGTQTNGNGVTIFNNGAFVIGGTTFTTLVSGSSQGGVDFFVRKYSVNNAVLWTIQFRGTATDAAGSGCLDADTNGNIYMVGSTVGTLNGE